MSEEASAPPCVGAKQAGTAQSVLADKRDDETPQLVGRVYDVAVHPALPGRSLHLSYPTRPWVRTVASMWRGTAWTMHEPMA